MSRPKLFCAITCTIGPAYKDPAYKDTIMHVPAMSLKAGLTVLSLSVCAVPE